MESVNKAISRAKYHKNRMHARDIKAAKDDAALEYDTYTYYNMGGVSFPNAYDAVKAIKAKSKETRARLSLWSITMTTRRDLTGEYPIDIQYTDDRRLIATTNNHKIKWHVPLYKGSSELSEI